MSIIAGLFPQGEKNIHDITVFYMSSGRDHPIILFNDKTNECYENIYSGNDINPTLIALNLQDKHLINPVSGPHKHSYKEYIFKDGVCKCVLDHLSKTGCRKHNLSMLAKYGVIINRSIGFELRRIRFKDTQEERLLLEHARLLTMHEFKANGSMLHTSMTHIDVTEDLNSVTEETDWVWNSVEKYVYACTPNVVYYYDSIDVVEEYTLDCDSHIHSGENDAGFEYYIVVPNELKFYDLLVDGRTISRADRDDSTYGGNEFVSKYPLHEIFLTDRNVMYNMHVNLYIGDSVDAKNTMRKFDVVSHRKYEYLYDNIASNDDDQN